MFTGRKEGGREGKRRRAGKGKRREEGRREGEKNRGKERICSLCGLRSSMGF